MASVEHQVGEKLVELVEPMLLDAGVDLVMAGHCALCVCVCVRARACVCLHDWCGRVCAQSTATRARVACDKARASPTLTRVEWRTSSPATQDAIWSLQACA
jgi:hypothetical protein